MFVIAGIAAIIAGQTTAQQTNGTQSDISVKSAEAYNAAAITRYTLLADTVEMGIDISKSNSLSYLNYDLKNLKSSLIRSETSSQAKAEFLMNVATIHLKLLGETNSASIIEAGSKIAAKSDKKLTASYMRGIAQDLRKSGSIMAAQYLENNANLVLEDLYSTTYGTLDAGSLALKFGTKTQPGLSEILSYDVETISFQNIRGITEDLFTHYSQKQSQEEYQNIILVMQTVNTEKTESIKAFILEAQKEKKEAAEARYKTNIQR